MTVWGELPKRSTGRSILLAGREEKRPIAPVPFPMNRREGWQKEERPMEDTKERKKKVEP